LCNRGWFGSKLYQEIMILSQCLSNHVRIEHLQISTFDPSGILPEERTALGLSPPKVLVLMGRAEKIVGAMSLNWEIVPDQFLYRFGIRNNPTPTRQYTQSSKWR
jgi:hypothetical protein